MVHGASPGGGSLALAELIDEHGTALVSDFRSYHGVWLWDAVDEVPPRILLALVEELPDYEAFAASIQGGREFRGWGGDRHMLANLWDITALTGGALESKGSKKAPKFPRPGKKKSSGPTMRDLVRAATRQQGG